MPSMRISKVSGGGKNSNTVTGTEGPDTLRGTNGNDLIDGRGGADILRGGRGNDIYVVDNPGDTVVELAGEGVDEVRSTISYTLPANVENLTLLGTTADATGNSLDNRITGNEGANSLRGFEGNDFIVGGGGDDFVDGGAGGDHMDGGAGNDTYVVDNPTDFAFERTGGGTDTVRSSINYQLSPELENLTLIGGAYVGMGNFRDNHMIGNDLGNRLDGREGNDWIDGGIGNDTLIGGLGADSFAFTSALGSAESGNVDTIVDFEAGVDRIVVDTALFVGLVPGTLTEEAFRIGVEAADADDRIIYDPGTGNLWFDADGNGSAAMINFAAVSAGTNLNAGDFVVQGPLGSAAAQQTASVTAKTALLADGIMLSSVEPVATGPDVDGAKGASDIARVLADTIVGGEADGSSVDQLLAALPSSPAAPMASPLIADAFHSDVFSSVQTSFGFAAVETMAFHPDAAFAA